MGRAIADGSRRRSPQRIGIRRLSACRHSLGRPERDHRRRRGQARRPASGARRAATNSLRWPGRDAPNSSTAPSRWPTTIAQAKALGDYPVVLADHGNNTASGGSADTMEIHRRGAAPGAVDGIVAGPDLRSRDGRRHDRGRRRRQRHPAGRRPRRHAQHRPQGAPLTLTGTVRAITDGQFTVTGPMMTGVKVSCGRTAVLDTGPLQLVVSEERSEPVDLGVFTHCGLDPLRAQYIDHLFPPALPRRLPADREDDPDVGRPGVLQFRLWPVSLSQPAPADLSARLRHGGYAGVARSRRDPGEARARFRKNGPHCLCTMRIVPILIKSPKHLSSSWRFSGHCPASTRRSRTRSIAPRVATDA